MDILKSVRDTVLKQNLIKKGDKVLVALSGGADSVCLLHTLLELAPEFELTIAAAHINHNLRQTSGRDMLFCSELCNRLGIEFFLKSADVKAEAKKEGVGEELYARNLRYSFFSSLGFDKIATAHNKNDNAETVLFHFIRGAGLGGLGGIPYMRDNIIRPLLDVKKEDILSFCRDNAIEYVTDETNFEPIYSRNKLRLNIIPEIEKELNPGFCDVVTSNCRILGEDSAFLDKLAEQSYSGKIHVCDFHNTEKPILRRILQAHYKKCTKNTDNLSSVYIDALLKLLETEKNGKRINLPGNYDAFLHKNELFIEKRCKKNSFSYKIVPGEWLNIEEIGKNILIFEASGGEIYLDNTENLSVRSRRSGDFFYPVGMTGKKKLSDYFTDKKILPALRDTVPLLCSGNDIVSVIGYRNDRRYLKGGKAYKLLIEEANNAKK